MQVILAKTAVCPRISDKDKGSVWGNAMTLDEMFCLINISYNSTMFSALKIRCREITHTGHTSQLTFCVCVGGLGWGDRQLLGAYLSLRN